MPNRCDGEISMGTVCWLTGLQKTGSPMCTTGKRWVLQQNSVQQPVVSAVRNRMHLPVESYRRSQEAWKTGKFKEEVVPVEIKKKGETLRLEQDEEPFNVKFEKIPSLKPAFLKDGTVTAANASTMNDGAAAMILVSEEKLKQLGLIPLARILSYADAEQAPEWFTTSPAIAVPKAVSKAGLKMEDIAFWELNEAFAVVGIENSKRMELDPARVNLHGGAVSLGHPLGCSGARILVTLLHILKQQKARYGAAGICNGGGGASALVIENLL